MLLMYASQSIQMKQLLTNLTRCIWTTWNLPSPINNQLPTLARARVSKFLLTALFPSPSSLALKYKIYSRWCQGWSWGQGQIWQCCSSWKYLRSRSHPLARYSSSARSCRSSFGTAPRRLSLCSALCVCDPTRFTPSQMSAVHSVANFFFLLFVLVVQVYMIWHAKLECQRLSTLISMALKRINSTVILLVNISNFLITFFVSSLFLFFSLFLFILLRV